MAKFKNTQNHDVYVDFGKLILVRAGESINLEGALSCPPLTLVLEESPKKPVAKVPQKTPKKSDK